MKEKSFIGLTPGDHLKSVELVDEDPVSHFGLLVVVGQVTKATQGRLQ